MKIRFIIFFLSTVCMMITFNSHTPKTQSAKDWEGQLQGWEGQLKNIPNMTEPDNLTYSIRGIDKDDPRYRAIQKGVLAWNTSADIEFVREISPYQGYKRKNNHIFIDVVTYNSQGTIGGKASMYHVTLYDITKRITPRHVQSLTSHEVGHTLGLDEMPWSSKRVMSPDVYEKNYIDSNALTYLKNRYSNDGQKVFGLYNSQLSYQWSEERQRYLFEQGYRQKDVSRY